MAGGAGAPVAPCRYRRLAAAASIYSSGVLPSGEMEMRPEFISLVQHPRLQSGAIFSGVRREGDWSADCADGRRWDGVVLT